MTCFEAKPWPRTGTYLRFLQIPKGLLSSAKPTEELGACGPWLEAVRKVSLGVGHLVQATRQQELPRWGRGDSLLMLVLGGPVGKAHIGWKVLALQCQRLLEANANVMIFLADWHAWVNGKFDGDMEGHPKRTAIFRTCKRRFRALLNHPPEGDGPWGNSVSYGPRTAWNRERIGCCGVRRVRRCRWCDKDVRPSWGVHLASSDHDLLKILLPHCHASLLTFLRWTLRCCAFEAWTSA